MKVAVYCGATSGIGAAYGAAAEAVGRWIVENGHTLIYGGGDSGLMGRVAGTVHAAGGKVIGVVPGNVPFIRDRSQTFVTELIVAENMSERKRIMLEKADCYIALPGGVGTIDEVTEVITLVKIGVQNKKCVLYNAGGFYEPLREMYAKMITEGFLLKTVLNNVLFSEDLQEIDAFLKED